MKRSRLAAQLNKQGRQMQGIRVEKKLRGDDEPLDLHQDVPCAALIHSLPNEILAEIFEVLISRGQPHTFPIQHAISSVSHHWRAIAISIPRLWSTIIFHDPNAYDVESKLRCLSLWIERSAPCTLDITIASPEECGFQLASKIKLAIDRIIPHSGRWSRLTIQNIRGSLVEHTMAALRTASAPLLKHLDLSAHKSLGYFIQAPDRIFTGGATALTSARIAGFICTPPLKGLTALHFGGVLSYGSPIIRLTHEEFRDLLTASPSLTDLALEALHLLPSQTAPVVPSIQIPSLRTLSLNFTFCEDSFIQILTLLSMPNLETLSLAHMTTERMDTFEIFSRMVVPNYAALQNLKLFMCSTLREHSSEPPDSFYSTFSSITHLYLISTANFILEPTFHDRGEKIRWPNLRAVTIWPEVLPDIILSRKARGHPIATAYVPHDSLTSDENLWAGIREEVQVFEIDKASESLQYPGGLDQEEDDIISNHYDDYDSGRSRRAFYEQTYGVDYDSDGSVESELLEYWAVCGSD